MNLFLPCRLVVAISAAAVMACATPAARAQTPPAANPVAPPAPTAAPQKQEAPKATEAEITFWNSVKDTRNPAELKAYLDAYPNGTFSALARIRIAALDKPAPSPAASATPSLTQPAAPPTAAAPSASTASAITSIAVIREVYDKLYNLNYSVGTIADQMTPELRTAISSWQRRLNKAATGDLTQSDLALLRSATVPMVWGALAYSAGGASQAVWRQSSRVTAETTALAACRRAASNGQCNVVTAALKGCGAVAHSSGIAGGARHIGAFAAVRDTLVEASDSAMADCRLKGKVPSACKIRNVFCADGSHTAIAPATPKNSAPPKQGTKPGLQL